MKRSHIGYAFLGHGLALVMFFPILWMLITAFKTEINAFTIPPVLFFKPTLSSLYEVFSRGSYSKFVTNSIVSAVGSTILCLAFAVPAAYQMAFYPSKRTNATLLWMISTKMMPAVGVVIPIYLIFKAVGLLDNIIGLVLIFFLMNLPLAVWMLFTYFKEIPGEILEAARVDGAGIFEELRFILLPAAVPGIASTALLCTILSWNESFWSLQLTAAEAAPLTVFIASFKAAEGMFWAKMSGASMLAIGPIVVLGWMLQKHLVRGLTFGAVK